MAGLYWARLDFGGWARVAEGLSGSVAMGPCGQVFFVNEEGAQLLSADLRQRTIIGADGRWPHFTAGGDWLTFAITVDGESTLRRIDLRGGVDRRMESRCRAGPSGGEVRVGPMGQWVQARAQMEN